MEHYGSAIGSGNDTSRVLDSVKIHFPQKVIHLELSTSLSFSLCKYIRQSRYCTWTDPDYNRTLLSISIYPSKGVVSPNAEVQNGQFVFKMDR